MIERWIQPLETPSFCVQDVLSIAHPSSSKAITFPKLSSSILVCDEEKCSGYVGGKDGWRQLGALFSKSVCSSRRRVALLVFMFCGLLHIVWRNSASFQVFKKERVLKPGIFFQFTLQKFIFNLMAKILFVRHTFKNKFWKITPSRNAISLCVSFQNMRQKLKTYSNSRRWQKELLFAHLKFCFCRWTSEKYSFQDFGVAEIGHVTVWNFFVQKMTSGQTARNPGNLDLDPAKSWNSGTTPVGNPAVVRICRLLCPSIDTLRAFLLVKCFFVDNAISADCSWCYLDTSLNCEFALNCRLIFWSVCHAGKLKWAISLSNGKFLPQSQNVINPVWEISFQTLSNEPLWVLPQIKDKKKLAGG